MMKQGMMMLTSVEDITYQSAFSLTSQVLNTITIPNGQQYGTDSGEGTGEGDGDHSLFGLIRDHNDPSIYWRDALNPSFRKIRLSDLNMNSGANPVSLVLETGPYFIDMAAKMN
jgi:hypothetical protein